MKTITLYYDCLSPFSYLAFKVLQRYTQPGGLWSERTRLCLKPVLLGGIMASTGNSPPMMRPWAASQAKVSFQDFHRNRAWFGVPDMKRPPANFFGTDGPSDKSGLSRDFRYMRCLTAVSMRFPEALLALTDRVFAMIHTDPRTDDDHVVINNERLIQACVDSGLSPIDARDVVHSVTSKLIKDQLKNMVAEAVSLGAYGAPFIVVDDQVYFGSDRLEQLAFTHGLPWRGPNPVTSHL